DADVLLHAITDAILGALSMKDIGTHFPDNDPKYKNADSAVLLKEVWQQAKEQGFQLSNMDCTIIAQKPKIAPFIDAIRKRISGILEADEGQINVKATTTEGLGFTGRGEGIAALAVVLIAKE